MRAKAIALVSKSVMDTDLRNFFEQKCRERRIKLRFHCVAGDCSQYSTLFKAYQHVITWNCRSSHAWMSANGRNVLYIENSLLHQGAGIFVDHRGFYSQSNLCREKTWQNIHEVDLAAFTRQSFGWEPGQGGNPEGPILVCLQNALDANLRWEFPLATGSPDRLKTTVELLNQHLPRGVPVLLRPSPRFIEWWNEKSPSYAIRDDWTVTSEGKFKDVLPRCRALVTVNSTCASEAATLGIPVATLGTGAFTGSGISLECAHDPTRLQDILTWTPALGAGRRYGEAILGRHFLPYRKPNGCEEFERWLDQCTLKKRR